MLASSALGRAKARLKAYKCELKLDNKGKSLNARKLGMRGFCVVGSPKGHPPNTQKPNTYTYILFCTLEYFFQL